MKSIFAIYSKTIAVTVISSFIYIAGNAQVKQPLAALASYTTTQSIQFSAVKNNGAVSISWNTTISANDFTIERSFDGNEFKTVCHVFGIEQSEVMESFSRYNDRSADLNGKTKAYYRIRQADKNGNVSYTDQVMVSLK